MDSASAGYAQAPAHTATKARAIPGEPGIWVLVLGDMLIFALFFCLFTWYRADHPQMFAESQATLNQNYGTINTLFLLASSWFVVMAVNAAKQQFYRPIPWFFGAAFICGFCFGVVKILEYREKLAHGITITSNEFYMLYYTFTAIHFMHVCIGLCVLGYMILRSRHGRHNDKDVMVYETGGIFWHMVDLLWIVLFPLIYFLK